MKYLFALLFCACTPLDGVAVVKTSGTDRMDCLPTAVAPITVTVTQMITPDMIYFCSKFDVADHLKCLQWDKSYKAMICVGKDCKTWTQGEAIESFGTPKDKDLGF